MNYETITLHMVITNPRTKKDYQCECQIPKDCLNMTTEELEKSYGKSLTKTLYDLLNYPKFKEGLPKVILS